MIKTATPIPKPVMTYARLVGAVIEHHRKGREITQEQMAKALNVSQSAYSRLELGQSAMNVSQLRVIAAQLQIPQATILAHAERYADQLRAQGVTVTDEKPDSTAGVLIALGILAALIAAAGS